MKAMDSILKQSGEFSSYDGTRVYYESRGQGSPLIFCYGVGCLFNHWSPQIRYFSKQRQVIIFDYRGHHQTPIPENKKSLNIRSLSKDLIALCEFLKIQEADFVGHSFGVQVLLEAYKKKSKLFKTMSFINGLYRNPFESLIKADHLLNRINQIKKLYNQAPQIFSLFWKKGVTHPLFIPLSALVGGFNLNKTALKDIEIYTQGIASTDVRVFITFFEEMIAFQGEDILQTIEIPTLIICGSKDALTPTEDQKKMNQLIPNSELCIIPYGSHCTQLDFPDRVNIKIQNFIENHRAFEKVWPDR